MMSDGSDGGERLMLFVYLTLSAHAREGYSSVFVCLSAFDFMNG